MEFRVNGRDSFPVRYENSNGFPNATPAPHTVVRILEHAFRKYPDISLLAFESLTVRMRFLIRESR